MYHGWLNIDKPLGMTSAQVVGRLKRMLQLPRKHKIGHSGTLDPLASGVLPIAIGEATKTIQYVMDGQKTYQFTLCFGEATATDDAEGEVVETSGIRPSKDAIESVLSQFMGEIRQIPPIYSAIKVDGKRAYDLARAGEEVNLKAREVTIFNIEIVSVTPATGLSLSDASPWREAGVYVDNDKHDGENLDLSLRWDDGIEEATFSVTCSKGTYIRSLARDMARELDTVGHVGMLWRTASARFDQSTTISLDFLEKMVQEGGHDGKTLRDFLLPVEAGLDDILAVSIDAGDAQALRQGQKISLMADDGFYVAKADGTLVALLDVENRVGAPRRVFNL